MSTATTVQPADPGLATRALEVRPRPARVRALASRWPQAAGLLGVLVAWELLGRVVLAGSYAIPPVTAVVATAVADWALAWPNLLQTAREAALGWLAGNVLALVLAAVLTLARPVQRVAVQVSLALYCLPLIAIAPILSALLVGDAPQVVIAAQAVFFTTLVALLLGARSTERASLDVVAAAGGSRWQELVKVRLVSALPAAFGGLRIAAPAAVLGALVGEYLGAQKGLGVAMVYAQQSLDVERTWALALYATALAGAAYAATALAARLTCSWAVGLSAGAEEVDQRSARTRTLAGAATAVGGVAVVLLLWQLVATNLNPYFAKGPGAVWSYLVAGDPVDRATLLDALATTARDAALGYAAGTLAALALAMLVVTVPAVDAAVMPVSVALRAVPLVAMTPLIALVFGRGLTTVVVIAGLVTFFPSLVTVVTGLRAVPSTATDLLAAYGASPTAVMLKARLPFALPGVFAAARIAAPSAVLGALLAEWLATGDGIGYLMLRSSAAAKYDQLWSAVALVTLLALLAYAAAATVEDALLRRRAA